MEPDRVLRQQSVLCGVAGAAVFAAKDRGFAIAGNVLNLTGSARWE